MKQPESMFVRMIKHPYIWGGVGTLIRYADDDTNSGAFWRAFGFTSIMVGIGHSIATKENIPYLLDASILEGETQE